MTKIRRLRVQKHQQVLLISLKFFNIDESTDNLGLTLNGTVQFLEDILLFAHLYPEL